ncbi:MAG: toll/interleukin-1 receptor domain-containing protein [Verrucomicrobiota bacterium]
MRKGVNVFDEVGPLFGTKKESAVIENFSNSGNPCIFLSHQSTDKAPVVAIGKYIRNAGIDIYMDIGDEDLQAAIAENNYEAITQSIERGITYSTDLMACVSATTFHSCWVPYEIGFAKRAKKHLCALRLNDIQNLPSYLSIQAVQKLDGISELKAYLKGVKHRRHGVRNVSATFRYMDLLTEGDETDAALENFSNTQLLHRFLDA